MPQPSFSSIGHRRRPFLTLPAVRRGVAWAWALSLVLAASVEARGDFAVVSNRTRREVTLTIAGTPVQHKVLASGDIAPIHCRGGTRVTFPSGKQQSSYQLVANGMYFLGESSDGGTQLHQIGLTQSQETLPEGPEAAPVEDGGLPAPRHGGDPGQAVGG